MELAYSFPERCTIARYRAEAYLFGERLQGVPLRMAATTTQRLNEREFTTSQSHGASSPDRSLAIHHGRTCAGATKPPMDHLFYILPPPVSSGPGGFTRPIFAIRAGQGGAGPGRRVACLGHPVPSAVTAISQTLSPNRLR